MSALRLSSLVACGLCVGALVWFAGLPANGDALIPQRVPEVAKSEDLMRDASAVRAADLTDRRVVEPAMGGGAEALADVSRQGGAYSRSLSLEEERALRMGLGVPQSADWQELVRGGVFNPDGLELSDAVRQEVDAIVARARPVLDGLGAYVVSTQALELEQLREAGVAIVLMPGESPWTKMKEKDLVYTVQVNGAGIAASRSKMPRLLEAQGNLLAAGKDLGVEIAIHLERRGVFGRDHGAWLKRLIESWHL